MISINDKSYPSIEEEFNKWDETHIQLFKETTLECAKFVRDFNVSSMNYFGNSCMIYKLGKSYPKDKIDINSEFNRSIELHHGKRNKIILYFISDTELALISDETYYDWTLDQVDIDNNKEIAENYVNYINEVITSCRGIYKKSHMIDSIPLYNYVYNVWDSNNHFKFIDNELMELQSLYLDIKNGWY